MGYSLTGNVAEVGADVEAFAVGDRVAAVAPHAEYVTVAVGESQSGPAVVHLPDGVSMETGTFWPLTTSAVLWIQTSDPGGDEMTAIQGQGLVGSLCMQVAVAETGAELVAIDALALRCELAERLGVDSVIDCSENDPVAAVDDLTDGNGADVVIEAVGGPAGAEAFEQAQETVAAGGRLQVIGLYERPRERSAWFSSGSRLLDRRGSHDRQYAFVRASPSGSMIRRREAP